MAKGKSKAGGSDSEIRRMKRLARSVRYRGINPKEDYDRDTFVEAVSELEDLTKYADGIKKNPHDLGARRDLSTVLFGSDKRDFHMGLSPETMGTLAKDFRDGGTNSLGKYAEKNFDYMFDRLDPEALEGLLMSLPLYKTGKDAEHDDLVDALAETRKMGEMLKERDGGKIKSYVAKSLKEEDLPDWVKKAVIGLVQVDEAVAYKIFNDKHVAMNNILARALYKEDGKLDEAKARKLIKDSLERAKEAHDDETNGHAKGDIWKDVVRPYYIATAKAFYPSERAEYDRDRPEEIIKMNERELERKQLRMAA